MGENQIAIGQVVTEDQLNQFSNQNVPDADFEQLVQGLPVGGVVDLNEKKPLSPETSSNWLKEYGHNVWQSTKRAAGVGIGLLNAPLALAWGSANAKNVNPEEYAKLPYWKQELVSLRAGLESAWESISEKGKFGTLYGDYYKGTTGKTIDDKLKSSKL